MGSVGTHPSGLERVGCIIVVGPTFGDGVGASVTAHGQTYTSSSGGHQKSSSFALGQSKSLNGAIEVGQSVIGMSGGS